MSQDQRMPDVAPGRLTPEDCARNFDEIAPPLSPRGALSAAQRCLLCADAPCIAACPTGIDVPRFIEQIGAERPEAAARTILEANILGGICARVCPTRTLCEGACVRMSEGAPVEIGRLQRFATDSVQEAGVHPFERSAPTGRRVAVVGAGPAGLACAHRLAMKGHDVVVHDAREKPGGLNEYGVAGYRGVGGFAQAEVAWLMRIGGIALRTGQRLGRELSLAGLEAAHDAVFLGIGLAGVNALRAEGEAQAHVRDAVDFIAELRQAADVSTVPVGRHVVVIGGGMTAVEAAVQCRLVGAEQVTVVYRRSRARMSASTHEQDFAASKGVRIVTGAAPVRLTGGGHVTGVEFARTEEGPDGLRLTDETFILGADMVLKAIGQHLDGAPGDLDLAGRKIAVTGPGRTTRPGVWAGGDCATGGDDLTVTAVAAGRDAAEDIHAHLTGRGRAAAR